MGVPPIEEIFLAQMTQRCLILVSNRQIVINNEPYPRISSQWSQLRRDGFDLLHRPIFGPELNQVGTAIAKLSGNLYRIASGEIGRIDECVELALVKRFHASLNLIFNQLTPCP